MTRPSPALRLISGQVEDNRKKRKANSLLNHSFISYVPLPRGYNFFSKHISMISVVNSFTNDVLNNCKLIARHKFDKQKFQGYEKIPMGDMGKHMVNTSK